MYEVEIKVELTNKEREDLIEFFAKRGFLSEGVTPQNDYYIEAKKSPHGGTDLKRYRNEDGTFIYTEKVWEMAGDLPVRRENEHEVSKEEFDAAVEKFPAAIKIKKDRQWFTATYKEVDISITIDSVKFDHSPSMRYFIEAEIDIDDKNKVVETKEFLGEFLKEVLQKTEIKEAPGMFSMAFNKQ